ncbi:hypothetical protein SKAU_G00218260 [Synaphobranchus kaupii]|uniref:Uncharacterized protein n=1 Tax=Synaphobranchus kaupii TaxID=118154 RepID=A0A9Q1IV85_SYNKA|nr:hypothetical protein SKAU_G00218260 [Synaphobranchus kaupii]
MVVPKHVLNTTRRETPETKRQSSRTPFQNQPPLRAPPGLLSTTTTRHGPNEHRHTARRCAVHRREVMAPWPSDRVSPRFTRDGGR